MKQKWIKPWTAVTTRERLCERRLRAALALDTTEPFTSIYDLIQDHREEFSSQEVIDGVNRLYQRGRVAADLDRTKIRLIP